jgi:hypothetical protein
MGILEDVMKALERIPAWKRVQATPDQIAALQQRVAALEDRLKPATGKQCPSCGEMTFKLIRSTSAKEPWGSMGVREDHLACSTCSYTDSIQRNPGK